MRKVSLILVSLFLVSLVSASAQNDQAFVILDAGILIAESAGEPDLLVAFSLSQRGDGTHKLISTIIDPIDQVKSQDMTLTESFQPISYSRFQSSPNEDERTVRADFIDNRVIVSITNLDGVEQQTFTTETEFIIFDDSAVSQLSTMLERYLFVGEDTLAFDALIAENFSVIPSEFGLQGEINLRSGNEDFIAQEYYWTGPGGSLILRILALDGRFIGGIQQRDNGIDILYRQDLYPEGFEVIDS